MSTQAPTQGDRCSSRTLESNPTPTASATAHALASAPEVTSTTAPVDTVLDPIEVEIQTPTADEVSPAFPVFLVPALKEPTPPISRVTSKSSSKDPTSPSSRVSSNTSVQFAGDGAGEQSQPGTPWLRQSSEQSAGVRSQTSSAAMSTSFAQLLSSLRSESSAQDHYNTILDERYEMVRRLGQGAYGLVTLAANKQSGKQVAVKTMCKLGEDELTIIRRLDHPHIVRLHESIHHVEKMHLVLDLCLGGDLSTFIKLQTQRIGGSQVYFPPDSLHLARLTWQMFAAIIYLHFHYIAHRDVKPANFLIEAEADFPRVKLSDFNFACFFKKNVPMTDSCGSLVYMAPEVILGSYSELCDVWGLGVSLQSLVSGGQLFKTSDEDEFEALIVACKIPFEPKDWNDQPSALKKFVKQLLVKEADGRPSAKLASLNAWLRSGRPPSPCCCSIC